MPHRTTVFKDRPNEPVEHLAKVKEAGSQITTRIIQLRKPVVDKIE